MRRPGWAHIRSFFCTLSHPFSAGSPGQGWGLVKVCTKVQAAAVCTKVQPAAVCTRAQMAASPHEEGGGYAAIFPLKKK